MEYVFRSVLTEKINDYLKLTIESGRYVEKIKFTTPDQFDGFFKVAVGFSRKTNHKITPDIQTRILNHPDRIWNRLRLNMFSHAFERFDRAAFGRYCQVFPSSPFH